MWRIELKTTVNDRSTTGTQTYTVQISLTGGSLTVTSNANLVTFIETLLQSTSTIMYVNGIAAVQVNMATTRSGNSWVANTNYGFGTNSVEISNVAFASPITLVGFNSFIGKLQVGAVYVLGGTSAGLQFQTNLTLTGSQSIIATLGAFYLNMNSTSTSNNGYLGYAYETSGIVVPNTGSVTSLTTGVLVNNAFVSTLLSNWINSKPVLCLFWL